MSWPFLMTAIAVGVAVGNVIADQLCAFLSRRRYRALSRDGIPEARHD